MRRVMRWVYWDPKSNMRTRFDTDALGGGPLEIMEAIRVRVLEEEEEEGAARVFIDLAGICWVDDIGSYWVG